MFATVAEHIGEEEQIKDQFGVFKDQKENKFKNVNNMKIKLCFWYHYLSNKPISTNQYRLKKTITSLAFLSENGKFSEKNN